MTAEETKPSARWGATMLVGGNLVLAIILVLLQKLFATATERLVVLMLINLILGVGGVSFAPIQCFRVFARNRNAFIIFSLAYCAAYGAFLIFPTQLPLGLFMIASALSPLLAAIIIGLGTAAGKGSHFLMSDLTPYSLLVVLACLEGRFTSGGHTAAIFVFVLISHTAIQYGLRRTSRERVATQVTFVVSLLNAFFLLGLLYFVNSSYLRTTKREIGVSLAFSPMIVLLQFMHLSGLRRSTLGAGALAMSTSVPIGVLVEEITTHQLHPLSLVVSALFVFAVLLRRGPKTLSATT